ncbi:MAG: ABC transporter permease [Erysipelotrichales bacterium]|nr:ABC transporter permease [Erysipelotrichales bacterium]
MRQAGKMSSFKIILANLKKRKGATVTFFVLIILAAQIFSMSLALITGLQNFYDKKLAELNGPHFSTHIIESVFRDEFKEFALDYEGVTEVSAKSSLFTFSNWQANANSVVLASFLMRESDWSNSFYRSPIIDDTGNKPENFIYLPLGFRFNYGVRAGETISLEGYEFYVSGFFEDAVSGASSIGIVLAYISDSKFNLISSEEKFMAYRTLMIRFENPEMNRDFSFDFFRFTEIRANEIVIQAYDTSKIAVETFISIAAMMLIIFTIIILLISLVIVSFSITNSISEEVIAIGALKSIGYKNKKLRQIQLMQYFLISGIGSIIGIFITLVTFGFIGNIIASTSGLLWLDSTNLFSNLVAFVSICALTALITYIASSKYKKITPVNALRHGEENHSFKKNPLPLERKKMSLNIHLGVKRFINSFKNNLILTVTVMLLVFTSLLVNVMNYNMNVNRSAMIQMVGIEMSDIIVQVSPGVDIFIKNELIVTHPEVKQTILNEKRAILVDGLNTIIDVYEDFSKLATNTIVRGRNPDLRNEVVLASNTARAAGKDIGDTVVLDIDGIKKSYIIVGISQNIAEHGEGAAITVEAIYAHIGIFNPESILIYLNEGVNVSDYLNGLQNIFGNTVTLVDVQEQMDLILDSMSEPISILTIIMISMSIIIIAFVLFLIISTLIKKQKKEFGIMKALGYRNNDLIKQLIISFLPSLVVGTILGNILNFTIANEILSLFFSGIGLLRATFIIPLWQTLIVSLSVFGAGFLVLIVLSMRLRKISPQKLIIGY